MSYSTWDNLHRKSSMLCLDHVHISWCEWILAFIACFISSLCYACINPHLWDLKRLYGDGCLCSGACGYSSFMAIWGTRWDSSSMEMACHVSGEKKWAAVPCPLPMCQSNLGSSFLVTLRPPGTLVLSLLWEWNVFCKLRSVLNRQ